MIDFLWSKVVNYLKESGKTILSNILGSMVIITYLIVTIIEFYNKKEIQLHFITIIFITIGVWARNGRFIFK